MPSKGQRRESVGHDTTVARANARHGAALERTAEGHEDRVRDADREERRAREQDRGLRILGVFAPDPADGVACDTRDDHVVRDLPKQGAKEHGEEPKNTAAAVIAMVKRTGSVVSACHSTWPDLRVKEPSKS